MSASKNNNTSFESLLQNYSINPEMFQALFANNANLELQSTVNTMQEGEQGDREEEDEEEEGNGNILFEKVGFAFFLLFLPTY